MKNIFKFFIPLFSVFLFLFLIFPANAGIVKTNSSTTDAFQSAAGFSGVIMVDDIIASAIRIALGFLAIIFIVLIIISGYQWMTAGGNEEAVSKSQKRIKNAIIGLLIVILAYAVTAFVFKVMPGVGSGDTGSGGSNNSTQTNPPREG